MIRFALKSPISKTYSIYRRPLSTSASSKYSSSLRRLFIGGLIVGIGISAGVILQNRHSFIADKRSSLDISKQSDAFLDSHLLVLSYRKNPEFKESRYYDRIPSFFLNRMVTRLLFTGPGFLTLEPLVFESRDGKEIAIFFHVGDSLSGATTDKIHRGFLTTLMDDGLVRAALFSLPHHYAVTASLQLTYESHVPANSYLVLRSKLSAVEGRKAWTEGSLDIMNRNSTIPAVSATMLAVEPRYAKYSSWIFAAAT